MIRTTVISKVALIASLSILLSTSVASTVQRVDSVESTPTLSEIGTAEAWNLSQSEFAELRQLKIRYQGMMSSELTPLEWLGIFSETEEQRDHYANLFARRQLEVTSAVLKFEAAYIEAIKSLSSQVSQTPSHNDRLLLVSNYHCADLECRTILKEALAHVNRGGYLDIYVKNETPHSNLGDWATDNQVPINLVRNGNITIKQAKGRMLNVKSGIYRAK